MRPNPAINPAMDAQQARLVQDSFAHARRVAPHLTATFYRELFAIDPALRPLFKGDILIQSRKLMALLTHVVEQLHDISQVLPDVRDLGAQHATYGITAAHYDTLETALMRTLRHELGSGIFTNDVHAAWRGAYKLLAREMLEAGSQAPPRAI